MNYNYYQVGATTTIGSTTTTASTTTNSGDYFYWYQDVQIPAANDRQYPNWLQPSDTASGTATSNMKYCSQCYVYYFGEFHTHMTYSHQHCCC